MKLSVIIPLYNCEIYIERAIESVYNQGIPNDEFEVVVVDDGSKDSSYSVVDKLRSKYSNLVLLSQENQGEGAARNTALEKAKGEYFLCLDADDYLEPYSIAPLLNKAIQDDIEILFYKLIHVYENKIKKESTLVFNNDKCGKIMTGKEAISLYRFHHSVCTSLFKRKFVDSLNIKFTPSIWGTDVLYLTTLLLQANRVYRSDKICYNYVMYNQTAVTSKVSRNLERHKQLGLARLNVSSQLKKMILLCDDVNDIGCIYVLENSISIFMYFGIINLLRSNIEKHKFNEIILQVKNNNLYPIKATKYNLEVRDRFLFLFINNLYLLKLLKVFL